MIRRNLALLFLTLLATGAFAQSVPVDIEIGYRWLDLDGSEGVYRTQINEEDGFLIRAMTIDTVDFDGGAPVMDHFRLDVNDLGAGPFGTLRLETGKSNAWNLHLSYRQADAFNFHPGFALGQHLTDRQRTMFDADLEILPGRRFVPFIGVSTAEYEGPGTTTYALGQDEFLLNSDLNENEVEFRGGVAFSTGRFTGLVMQGWRDVESEERMTLAPGAGNGNNPGSILGRPVSATLIDRTSRFDVSTPFTNAYVTAQVTSRVRLIGNYSQFSAEGDGGEIENATGSFVSFPLARFFNGLTDNVGSRAETDTWRGGIRGEVSLARFIDVFAGWRTEERDMSGAALFETIFRESISFGGGDPVAALEEIFEAESAMGRSEDVLEVGASARALGPFSLRGAFRRTTQDFTMTPAAEEIAVDSPGQRGTYERSIDTIDLSGTFTQGPFTATLALRRDSADEPVVRTDFLDRNRIRLGAAYRFRGDLFRLGVHAEQLDQENDRTGFGYDGQIRNYGADVEVAPFEHLRFRAAYTRFDSESEMSILRPETLTPDRSLYTEDGDAIEAGIALFFAPVTFDADYSTYTNDGSNAFDIDRIRARAAWNVRPHIGIGAEWAQDSYEETLLPIADFEATRYGLFVRFNR